MTPGETNNIHSDHRKRMKARFLSRGLSEFEQHEMLELLLYYALPRKDTNALGHELIARFGSLSGVFDAPIERLCEVPGVSEHTAILLKMVPQLAKEYMCDVDREKDDFTDYDKSGQFFVSRFIGCCNERLYAAYFDNGMHLIDCVLVNEGDVNSSQVSIRKIVSCALEKNASSVALAHNHPGGTVIPSADDLNVTNACEMALSTVGIKLVEHFIVAGGKYMGICYMRSCTLKD